MYQDDIRNWDTRLGPDRVSFLTNISCDAYHGPREKRCFHKAQKESNDNELSIVVRCGIAGRYDTPKAHASTEIQ